MPLWASKPSLQRHTLPCLVCVLACRTLKRTRARRRRRRKSPPKRARTRTSQRRRTKVSSDGAVAGIKSTQPQDARQVSAAARVPTCFHLMSKSASNFTQARRRRAPATSLLSTRFQPMASPARARVQPMAQLPPSLRRRRAPPPAARPSRSRRWALFWAVLAPWPLQLCRATTVMVSTCRCMCLHATYGLANSPWLVVACGCRAIPTIT